MKSHASWIAVAFTCMSLGQAVAQERPAPSPAWPLIGPYVGIAGVAAIPRKHKVEDGNQVIVNHATGGIDVRGGYRFHRALAAEVAFDWLGDVADHNSYLVTANGRLNPPAG